MLSKTLNFSTTLYVTILCILAWSLGKLFVGFLEVPVQVVQPEMIAPNVSQSTVNNRSILPPSYLLGRPEALLTQKVIESPELINKSRLNLKLTGLLKHPLKSIAVIDVNGRNQVFAVGDEILKGVELIEVGANFAVISNRGLHEKLELKTTPNILKNSRFDERSAHMSEVQSKKLNLIKDQVKNSPLSILGYVRYEFINKKGGPAMIKVWPKQETALFTALGFQPGDLLRVVNGHSIDELSSNPALWQVLLSETSLSVVIDRQGVEQTLNVEMP
ncbi:type II secretion system protein N [Thiomicrorhabdus arctica]|uniref:type II secretion system protein N n=1 Tax=Thiomicrorhabdus arctica TaxID=131540 RepID=UPI0003635165|nr:type II secretion system protein N [Thiomicrorhabdus arctica]